jgi:iron(III) transport system ATP-binding protein
MAGVELREVAKSFAKRPVLEGLSLSIRDGECFTFLGPSGCGKTVVLRLIAGFEKLSGGAISLGTRVVSDARRRIHVSPDQRNVGVVFQDYAVWPHKTVFENVVYPLAVRKVPKGEASARTMRAVGDVGLSGLEARLPYQLSGGQQQRVALARALVSGPEVMLLDEPLSNLDANLREEMRFEIKDLQRRTGVTILYVTHDQEVALAISDRMAVLDGRGTIRQVGPPDTIYEHPDDAFVFSFLGVANFIPVERRDGRAFVRGTAVPLVLPDLADDRTRPDGDLLLAGCRPTDVALTPAPPDVAARGAAGVLKRAVFLGASIDCRIDAGGTELRVQQDAGAAERAGLFLREGDTVGIRLHDVKWFDESSLAKEGLR